MTTDTSPREKEFKVRALSAAISARLVGADLVSLNIIGSSPNGLAAKLEAVSQRFLERMLSPERSAVDESGAFLQKQLDRQRKNLQKAEDKLSEFKSRNADNLPAVYTANVTRLIGLKEQFDTKSADLASLEASLKLMKKRLASTNPVVGQLEEKIVEITGQLASLRARYTNNHSQVRAAEQRLQRLTEERQLLFKESSEITNEDIDRLWNIAAGQAVGENQKNVPLLVSQMQALQEIESKREALQKDVDLLGKNINKLESNIARFGPIEKEVNRLSRNVKLAQHTFEEMTKRHEMAQVTQDLGKHEAPERVKIIDAPEDPKTPVTPGKSVYLIGGIIGAVFLGIGLAALLEFFDPTLRRREEFQKAVKNLPIIARIPRITQKTHQKAKRRKAA
ncbi:GumC family protein [Flexibacterium corallicola]|uniref:GumC family protein n=1 Tax=Flexibacterium corallicola TaxID=3037259 RepID=UPI00286F9889|nr:GNVR domain-containing protein [Pseudovibrio sp. M1P-2-3]